MKATLWFLPFFIYIFWINIPQSAAQISITDPIHVLRKHIDKNNKQTKAQAQAQKRFEEQVNRNL